MKRFEKTEVGTIIYCVLGRKKVQSEDVMALL